jgi:hypothetical protein
MSPEGSIYFFACHMLYTAMQIFYEFQEQAVLEMNQLSESYSRWMPNYEGTMGWSLEEIVFPFEHEGLDKDKAKQIGDFAERHDAIFYERVHAQLLTASYQWHEKYPTLGLNACIYYNYSIFITKVLEHFMSIMGMENMKSNVYFDHYQRDNAVVKTFYSQLITEIVRSDNLGLEILSDTKFLAEHLGAEWYEAVFAAVKDFENLSQSTE